MAEAIVSIVLEQLASILREQVEAGVNLVVGVEDEVQKLTSNFRAIKAVLEDAESRQVKENAVRDWMDKLKDTSYDIEDVLDQWNTAVRKLQLKKIENAFGLKKKVRSLIPAYRFSPKQIVLRREIGNKIKELNKKLDIIAKEKDMFSFSLMTKSTSEVKRQITTSVIDVSKVYGRDQEKIEIVNLLLNKSGQEVASVPIISIVGMGGSGKTTLAKLVYHDDRMNNHFDHKIWVCVSDPFDEIRIARAILESLQGSAPNLFELQTLLEKISKTIVTKKFLLILDDVWTEDGSMWEQLVDALKCSCRGSRILLTTRKENVAKIMRTNKMISLGKLSDEDSWSLFSQVALFGRTKEECDNLEDNGRKIVNKCNGLPLAIKTLGSLLSLKGRVEQWQSVLDSDMWKLEEIEERLFPPLLLSYYDLSPKLRKCFSYCAIFPKDYKIEKNKLIKLWMAQGYLNVEGRKDMELVGEEYFENLAMRSFFQDFEKGDGNGSITSCKMHDVVHDFAQFLTKNECLTVEIDGIAEPQLEYSCKNFRHSMIISKGYNVFPISICSETKLRSLLIDCEMFYYFSNDFASTLLQLFDKLTCLRMLEISGASSKTNNIPRGIKNLVSLRYLSFRNFEELKELPESVCDLYNLQTLVIYRCFKLEKLPNGIGKLINLRHLTIYGLSYMPKGMEKLTCLRTLNEFKVSSGVHGNKACTLECLGKLKFLEGSLKLRGLGNVRDVHEVKKADLKSLKNLLRLVLEFDKDDQVKERMNVENEAVLEAFEPPPNVKKLEIREYKSKTMSTHWMVSLTKLTDLELCFMKELKNFPCLGQLPSLESLYMFGIRGVRKVANEFLGIHHHRSHGDTTLSSSSNIAFPKLKSLRFQCMGPWEEWDFKFMGEDDEDNTIIMPCLRSLEIDQCPVLKSVPDQLLRKTTLEILKLHNSRFLVKRYRKDKGEDWHKISHIPFVSVVDYGSDTESEDESD